MVSFCPLTEPIVEIDVWDFVDPACNALQFSYLGLRGFKYSYSLGLFSSEVCNSHERSGQVNIETNAI